MSGLVKLGDIKWMKFDEQPKEDTVSVRLIIKLLTDCINEGRQVTIDDIRGIHADYSMQRGMHRAGWVWDKKEDPNGKWVRAKTKQEWLDNYSSHYRAIPWFKTNLGNAILKGRLLVIPVINIDAKTLTP